MLTTLGVLGGAMFVWALVDAMFLAVEGAADVSEGIHEAWCFRILRAFGEFIGAFILLYVWASYYALV